MSNNVKSGFTVLEMVPPGSLPRKDHRDPKSEYYVPNAPENRACADPNTCKHEGPTYKIDGAGVCFSDSLARRHHDPIRTVRNLVDAMAKPDFHLEPICRGCESWKPTQTGRPKRGGAYDATDSCFGCQFGHLDGVSGGGSDFVNHDKDAAFGAWANAKSEVLELELKRANATGAQKERYAKRLDKAHARVKRAAARCKRLGYSPTLPMRGGGDWIRPILPQTRDQRRKDTDREYRAEAKQAQRLVSPSCRNCRNWEPDERLSGASGSFGNCWVTGNVERAKNWCGDHNPKG